MRLMDSFTNEQFEEIIKNSFSYTECMRKMGYNSCSGDNLKKLKEKINFLNISTEHFTTIKGITRTEENVFCENSTANQSTLRRFYIKKYPAEECSICGLKAFWNGKPMTLILDHINGHNHDNRLENLRWVCPNCNIQLDTTSARNPNYKKYYCQECGKQVSGKNVKLCKECQDKASSFLQRTVNRPNREELKELIRTQSFCSIGAKYGVTDNAIRKWCDFEGLPRKKKDINKYTDEDWKLI